MEDILISSREFNEARRKIKENQGKRIVFTSQDDDLSRKVLEKENIQVLLINQSGRRDRLKQRNSGFNQVLAKIAKKKGVAIGINLDEILNADKEEKAKILARIEQNIVLCNKNKLKMAFLSKLPRDQYDLKALGVVLGMPTWMTKAV